MKTLRPVRAILVIACAAFTTTVAAQEGCALALDALPRVTAARAIDAGEFETLARLDANEYPGTANHGVYRGAWRGHDVFVKLPRAGKAELIVGEVYLTQLLGRMDVGPKLLGATRLGGHVGLVSEFVDGAHAFRYQIEGGRDDVHKRRARERLEELRRLGIIPHDAQFRRDADGTYWVIDPGNYLVSAPDVLREIELFTRSFPYEI